MADQYPVTMDRMISSNLSCITTAPEHDPIHYQYMHTGDDEPTDDPKPDVMISSNVSCIKTEPLCEPIQNPYINTTDDEPSEDTKTIISNLSWINTDSESYPTDESKPAQIIGSNLSCINPEPVCEPINYPHNNPSLIKSESASDAIHGPYHFGPV